MLLGWLWPVILYAQNANYNGNLSYGNKSYTYQLTFSHKTTYQSGNIVKYFYQVTIKEGNNQNVLTTHNEALQLKNMPNTMNADVWYIRFRTRAPGGGIHEGITGTTKVVDWQFVYRNGRLKEKGKRDYVSCANLDMAVKGVILAVIREFRL